MRAYHLTTAAAAEAILTDGFRDKTATYIRIHGPVGAGAKVTVHENRELTGVRISNVPLDQIEGESGDVELTMEIPEDLFTEYEWVEEVEGKPYREARIPAERLNRLGRPTIVKES
jgi:hypothetical protein